MSVWEAVYFLVLTMQVLRGRIVCLEMEICSCVKPSQAVQITTLIAVANHMRVFFPPLLVTCEVVPWLLDQVESEMYRKSSLVCWLSCTRGTCDSGHLMHAIMIEVSVEPRVLVLAELALYLLFSFTVYIVSFHSRQDSCLQDSCFSIHFVHMCISTRGSAYTL